VPPAELTSQITAMSPKMLFSLAAWLLLAARAFAQDVIRGRCVASPRRRRRRGPLNFSPIRFECLPAREGS
jgi:hypothetical protein